MSQKTTIAYHCDICGGFLCNGKDSAPNEGAIDRKFEAVEITIIEHIEWADDSLKAKQLCLECQDAVREMLKELRKRR